MSLSKSERETIIRFDEQDYSAMIYTYNEKLKAQLAEYAARFPEKVRDRHTDDWGVFCCTIPKQDLRIFLKKPRSDKQIAAARKGGENLRAMRNLQGSSRDFESST